MQNFEILLQEFEKVPTIEPSIPTIIEIAGFPHYENVCSNILAYYFETGNPHKLKNLLIKSLLDCVDRSLALEIIESNEVRREESTITKKRIDIIIETDDLVIAIENKIYASIYNDLDDYSRHVETKYNNKKKILKIILSLEPVLITKQNSGFINIVYSQFIENIKANLGQHILFSDNKSTIFLLDFMQSILNLTKPDTMNEAVLEFFIKNKQSIQKLIDERSVLQSHIANKVNKLKGLIPPQGSNVVQWIYKKHDLVHDFEFNGIIVAVDCVFDFDGIEILIWVRKGSLNNQDLLEKLELFQNQLYVNSDTRNNRIVAVPKESLPLLSSLELIAEKLNFVLASIILK